jgi:hypothetical protein
MIYKSRRTKLRRRRAQKREGAIMLIVLLIVLTATTLAATSLQSTQFELRGAGYNRTALQTQYVSEAAAMTTLAWIDATAMDRSFLKHLESWDSSAPGGTPVSPEMWRFGEPEILTANRAKANRTQWQQQQALANVTIPPLTYTGYSTGTFEDKLGTLGPRSPYVAGIQMDPEPLSSNYVVDMYDCRLLSNTASAGYQVNASGSGTMKYFQYYCVVTSRGRTYVPYPATAPKKPTKTWSVPSTSGNVPYVVNRFTMAHDSRGSIITPPMSQ